MAKTTRIVLTIFHDKSSFIYLFILFNMLLLFYRYLKQYREFVFEKRDQSVLPDAYPVVGDESCFFLTKKINNSKNKMKVKVTVTDQTAVTPITNLVGESPKKPNNANTSIESAGSLNTGNSVRHA